MILTKGELKPVKGKTKMVRVPITIRKLDLLRVSYEKHCARNRNFDKVAQYTIVYPDRTKILTLPDHPNRMLQLDDYQKEIGKVFNRITLFLLKLRAQELYNQLQQDSSNDTDCDSTSVEQNHTRQMSVFESFASAGSSTQTSCPSQRIEQSSSNTSTVTSLDLTIVDDHGMVKAIMNLKRIV